MKKFTRHKTSFFVVLLAFGLFLTDRLLKKIIIECSGLSCGRNFLKLHRNFGLSFGLPIGQISAIALPVVSILVLSISLAHCYKKGESLSCAFILAVILGAVSNLADRISHGYVIDYIDVPYFTVFNLADALTVGGIGGWMLLAMRKSK